eukprot:Sspe_Gene.12405::Locus_4228_Transcript_1_1_Confidence_1.000_Length_2415::g.12405::m.12405
MAGWGISMEKIPPLLGILRRGAQGDEDQTPGTLLAQAMAVGGVAVVASVARGMKAAPKPAAPRVRLKQTVRLIHAPEESEIVSSSLLCVQLSYWDVLQGPTRLIQLKSPHCTLGTDE